jgi:hypothetical protein
MLGSGDEQKDESVSSSPPTSADVSPLKLRQDKEPHKEPVINSPRTPRTSRSLRTKVVLRSSSRGKLGALFTPPSSEPPSEPADQDASKESKDNKPKNK